MNIRYAMKHRHSSFSVSKCEMRDTPAKKVSQPNEQVIHASLTSANMSVRSRIVKILAHEDKCK